MRSPYTTLLSIFSTLLILSTACSTQRLAPVEETPVASIAVTPTEVSIGVGTRVAVLAIPLGTDGATLARSVTWSTSDPAIASVTQTGDASAEILGVALGTASITATSGSKSNSIAVTVTQQPAAPVDTIIIAPTSASVDVGQTVQLSAVAKDASGNILTGRTINWSSSNTSIATVSSSGLVTGVAAGTAGITAAAEGRQTTAVITVMTPPATPVASVTVTPATASVLTGQTVQLSVTLKDASGNTLTGRAVIWTSSNTAVATVSSTGLVTGLATGSATMTATSEGVSGTSAVTVTATVTNPGTVTNLAVASVAENSVTLTFTEVNDGTGSPASYEVRYAVAPISWGSATPVTQGTCAVPLAGTGIGVTRTCSVLGLATSTSYQFQLVAFRGTLNVDAVFGSLSNIASATTAASTAPVASVTVTPSTVGLPVGSTQQLTATLKDANGNTLSGRVVTWSSSNTAVATVSSSGLVAAVAVGTATITATSEGKSGTASVTVSTTPPAGAWPNEPSGFTVMRNTAWDAVTPSGWLSAYNEDNLATITSDASAPYSPTNVLQFRYPAGFAGGSAPATIYTSGGITGKEYFIGMWWKPSNPWDGHSSAINKVFFFYTESWADLVLSMYGADGGPYYLRAVTQRMPSSGPYMPQNVNVVPVVLGQWHRIEVYAKYDSYYGANDGIIRWWVNGILVGNYTNYGFPNDAGFKEFQLSPTWGGIGDTKRQEDYYWYDHVYLSRR